MPREAAPVAALPPLPPASRDLLVEEELLGLPLLEGPPGLLLALGLPLLDGPPGLLLLEGPLFGLLLRLGPAAPFEEGLRLADEEDGRRVVLGIGAIKN